jgi:hypothetical protein
VLASIWARFFFSPGTHRCGQERQSFSGRLAHAMTRAPIVVQFYLVVVVAVAGTFFCGAAAACLTAGVAGFGLFATTGAV